MSEDNITLKMRFQMTVNSNSEIVHVTPEPCWDGMIGNDEWKASLVFGGCHVVKGTPVKREISLVLRFDKSSESNLWKMELDGVCSTHLFKGVTTRPFRASLDYKSYGVHVVENVCTPFSSNIFPTRYEPWVKVLDVLFEFKMSVKNSMMHKINYFSLLEKKPEYFEFKFTDGVRLYVSKPHLRVISTVFDRMLSGSFKESKEDSIEIKDRSSEVFHAFLRLTHNACDQYVEPELIPEVINLAHYYDCSFVAVKCESILMKLVMKRESSFEMLELADQYTLHHVNAFTFSCLPTDEVYRINHDSRIENLLTSTQSRLVELMRVQDRSHHLCKYCKGKPSQEGIPWTPINDLQHMGCQNNIFADRKESFRPTF